MPIHDWTRVDAGIFHSFHVGWIGELSKALNNGVLPRDFYALAEQLAGRIGPDVLTLQYSPPKDPPDDLVAGTIAVADRPPKVRITATSDVVQYSEKQRTVTIRHVSGHRLIALIEILSPGNKASAQSLRLFLDKVEAALAQGVHVLLIDLLPMKRRGGLHGIPWKDLTGENVPQPANKPLTLACYVGGEACRGYVEPVAVGDTLPDMPLFLHPEQYVNVPLEKTYEAAWQGIPRYYREQLAARAQRGHKASPKRHPRNGRDAN